MSSLQSSATRLINLVAIKTAECALTVLPLANVSVGFSWVARTPDHCTIGALWSSMPHTIAENAFVLTLVIRPDVCAFTITHVVLEKSVERALIVIILNASFAVQSTVFIPGTLVSAASNLDNALTDELTLAGHVVRSRGSVPHCK